MVQVKNSRSRASKQVRPIHQGATIVRSLFATLLTTLLMTRITQSMMCFGSRRTSQRVITALATVTQGVPSSIRIQLAAVYKYPSSLAGMLYVGQRTPVPVSAARKHLIFSPVQGSREMAML